MKGRYIFLLVIALVAGESKAMDLLKEEVTARLCQVEKESNFRQLLEENAIRQHPLNKKRRNALAEEFAYPCPLLCSEYRALRLMNTSSEIINNTILSKKDAKKGVERIRQTLGRHYQTIEGVSAKIALLKIGPEQEKEESQEILLRRLYSTRQLLFNSIKTTEAYIHNNFIFLRHPAPSHHNTH